MQGDVVKSRADARRALDSNGGTLHYGAWTFCGSCWVCGDGCCSAILDNVEEVLDTLEQFCGGNWYAVEVDK